MLNWANQFNICCLLDSQQYNLSHHRYECLLGAGAVYQLSATAGNALHQLEQFQKTHANDWLFGHLSYDLKNELEPLTSAHPDPIGFPDLFFFVPETVVQLDANCIRIATLNGMEEQVYQAIMAADTVLPQMPAKTANIQSRISRDAYIKTIEQLQQHIHRGDCYEINFCQEFYATGLEVLPVSLYHSLSELSPNPFAAYYRVKDRYLLCASPERYLKKQGDRVYSQPMKGTWQRNLSDEGADNQNRSKLLESPKERSENVMIVDLVRNDLSRICEEGSVVVDELFGIYSFPQVHQMVSTISGRIRPEITLTDAIRATFPMGSMTGAPKRRVLELIEQYEHTRRGIFSGAVGYCSPEGDFDFNVVIRSLMYNAGSRYLSYQVGSGITFYCDAEKEYAECLLKAEAIRKALKKS